MTFYCYYIWCLSINKCGNSTFSVTDANDNVNNIINTVNNVNGVINIITDVFQHIMVVAALIISNNNGKREVKAATAIFILPLIH